MSPETAIQATMMILTILGAGFAAYVGVKVALTRIEEKLKHHQEKFKEVDRDFDQVHARVNRLERRVDRIPPNN